MVPAATAMVLGLGPTPAGLPVCFDNDGPHAGMNPHGGSAASPYPADTYQLLNLFVPESRLPTGARNFVIVVEIPLGWSVACAHAPGASVVVPPLCDAVAGWERRIDLPVGDTPGRLGWARRDFAASSGAVWFPFTVRTPKDAVGSFAFRVHQRYHFGPDVLDADRRGGEIDWVDPPTCRPPGNPTGPNAPCPHPAPLRYVAHGVARLPGGEHVRYAAGSSLPGCCPPSR